MKSDTALKLQSIAVKELSENGKGQERMRLLKGKFPIDTVMTMEAMAARQDLPPRLKFYLEKIDLNISRINVEYYAENGETGVYKAFGSDAFWLCMMGYPATVENKILTVSIDLKDTIEVKEPDPRLGNGWLGLNTPSGHLVPVRYI